MMTSIHLITNHHDQADHSFADVPSQVRHARQQALTLMPSSHTPAVQRFSHEPHSPSASSSTSPYERSGSSEVSSPPAYTYLKREGSEEQGIRHDRVPISRASSHASPTASSNNGPMSAAVVIPPRPKPGRKPINDDDAADRRRTQNRLAQRNFRDKRQQKLSETQAELSATREAHRKEKNDMERRMAELRHQVRELQRVNDANEARRKSEPRAPFSHSTTLPPPTPTSAVRTSLPSVSSLLPGNSSHFHSAANRGDGVPTPPEEREMDFTNWRGHGVSSTPMTGSFRPATSTESSALGFTVDVGEGGCGFCTDNSNCQCKEPPVTDNLAAAKLLHNIARGVQR